MADVAYTVGLLDWAAWESGTFKMLLVDETYTADPDDEFVADVVAKELSGSGYARVTVSGNDLTIDTTNNRYTVDCDNPAFGTIVSGETIGGIILYREVTNDSDSRLMAFFDVDDLATDGFAYTPPIPSIGLATIAQAA